MELSESEMLGLLDTTPLNVGNDRASWVFASGIVEYRFSGTYGIGEVMSILEDMQRLQIRVNKYLASRDEDKT